MDIVFDRPEIDLHVRSIESVLQHVDNMIRENEPRVPGLYGAFILMGFAVMKHVAEIVNYYEGNAHARN